MAKITAKQLAKSLGISASAVSLALNGKPGVSEKTRAGVIRSAAECGYSVPRASEPAAHTAKKNICFLIYADRIAGIAEHTSFSTFVMQGAETAARELGYNVLIRRFTAGSASDGYAEVFSDADALILLGTDITERRLGEVGALLAFAHAIPVVVVDNDLLCERTDCIGNDNFTGALNAVKHLLSRGCGKIGYLRSRQRIANFDARADGVLSALAQAGRELFCTVDVGISSEQAYADMDAWLEGLPALPDAFFADNDVLAAAAVRALKRRRIGVPDQVSVIGFDDIPGCEMCDPPLSTVRSFKERLGSSAVRLIHSRLTAGESLATVQHTGVFRIQLSTELQIRQSVRAAAAQERPV